MCCRREVRRCCLAFFRVAALLIFGSITNFKRWTSGLCAADTGCGLKAFRRDAFLALPYFDHIELMLALANICSMLSPGGVLLHNELRPELPEDAAAAGLPVEQSRQVIVATVKGAPPLVDTVWLHRKAAK